MIVESINSAVLSVPDGAHSRINPLLQGMRRPFGASLAGETRHRRSSLLQMPVQLGVQPTFGNQLLVAAILGHVPAVEHQHPVGLLHRR